MNNDKTYYYNQVIEYLNTNSRQIENNLYSLFDTQIKRYLKYSKIAIDEDINQNIIIKTFDNLSKIIQHDNVNIISWIHTTTKHAYIDSFSKQKNFYDLDILDTFSNNSSNIEDGIIENDLKIVLTKTQQKFINELCKNTENEISHTYNISKNAIRMRKHYSKTKIKNYLFT